MTWFLIVLFLTINGGLETKEGWSPLQQPNLATCQQSLERVVAYLNSIEVAAVISCVQIVEEEGERV